MKHSWLLLFLVCFDINAYSQKGNDDLKYGKMPKPAESTYFITGQMLKSFSAVDVNGNKIMLNDLKGKVVVINFWFIECPPCRMEIPELNKIAVKYVTDPGVVFVAIAMDDKDAVNKFIKTNPFGYRHIDNGKTLAGLYKINLFPTNIVLDKNGKVFFHSSGYAPNTPYWITKSIEEAKQKSL